MGASDSHYLDEVLIVFCLIVIPASSRWATGRDRSELSTSHWHRVLLSKELGFVLLDLVESDGVDQGADPAETHEEAPGDSHTKGGALA